MIARGEMHAHPDRTVSSADQVAQARLVWDAARPEVEAAIAERLYVKARNRLPADAEIRDDTLRADVDFYRALIDDLLRFQSLLSKRVPALETTRRVLATTEGMGPVTRVTDQAIHLEVDGKPLSVAWAQVDAADLARLGRRALQGAKAGEQLALLAFAFAHAEEDAFWTARLDLRLSDLPPQAQRRVEAMEAALPARIAEKTGAGR